jgi:four helix bundle protein
MIKKFEDLGVWQEARELCKEIFSQISEGSFSKDFALVNQINRSSGSVMDNIAEGFGRSGNKEFIQYLSISKASCTEVKSQLYRALDRNYLKTEKAEELNARTQSLINQLGGFIHYLKQSEYKGSKFKDTDLVYFPNHKSRIDNPKS